MHFIKIAVSFPFLLPCLIPPREDRETTEGTPTEYLMTKKAFFLRLSPKKVDLLPEKVVSPPKTVDSIPETVNLHFSPLHQLYTLNQKNRAKIRFFLHIRKFCSTFAPVMSPFLGVMSLKLGSYKHNKAFIKLEIYSHHKLKIMNKLGVILVVLTSLFSCDLPNSHEPENPPIENPETNIDKHEFVDLGLSVKWATCNVGANEPNEYGDYFAWGEIVCKKNYDWHTYKWCHGSSTTLTKYCNKEKYGIVDYKAVLDKEDDVAAITWGGNWRVPTMVEFDELRKNCTWAWTCYNGIYGYNVTSKKEGHTHCHIFLPASGYKSLSSTKEENKEAYYWSNLIETDAPFRAYGLHYNSGPNGYIGVGSYLGRAVGMPIRPVCP